MPKCVNYPAINFFGPYEPEKWQKLGKGLEKYPTFRDEMPRSAMTVKSYESIKSTNFHETPQYEKVASRLEEHTKIEHSTFI